MKKAEMDEYWNAFIGCFVEATARIGEPHFSLAVAGRATPAIRERVYCYELYHQVRGLLDARANFPFALHGEVDKRGHPILGKRLQGRNPDFIVHIPGHMGPQANLAVVEVKPCGSFGDPVTKDADSLVAFIQEADYFRGVGLVFGGDEEAFDNHMRTVFAAAAQLRDRIHLYWHSASGQPAQPVEAWWKRF
jgi:hypothetical protein